MAGEAAARNSSRLRKRRVDVRWSLENIIDSNFLFESPHIYDTLSNSPALLSSYHWYGEFSTSSIPSRSSPEGSEPGCRSRDRAELDPDRLESGRSMSLL